jgi:Ca2+-binding RTX toxin-like protein
VERVKFTGGSGNDTINTGDSSGTIDGGGGHRLLDRRSRRPAHQRHLHPGHDDQDRHSRPELHPRIERIDLHHRRGQRQDHGRRRGRCHPDGDGDDTIDARTRPSGGASDIVDGGAGTDTWSSMRRPRPRA